MRHFLGRLVRFRALPYYYIPVRGICQEFFCDFARFFLELAKCGGGGGMDGV
jgi:hypothetical protein